MRQLKFTVKCFFFGGGGGGSGAVWWEGNSVTIVCVAKIHYWNGDTDVRGQ